jgi:hypothetical protein
VTDTNTTYTVGNGGLTQNNFTNALKTSYDGAVTHAATSHAPSNATANSSNATLLARANHTGTQAYSTITGTPTTITAGQASAIQDNTTHAASSHAPSGATVNSTDAQLKARANHTGTQAASTISDFDTEVANNSAVTANTAKTSNIHQTSVTGNAGSVTNGVYLTGNQAIAGNKTFSGNLTAPTSKIGWRDLDWAGAAANSTVESVQGDVIYHTATTSTTPGAIYYMVSNGNVALADANAVGTSSTLLMVALGTNASQGLLLRGVAQLRIDPNANPGLPIYLSTTTGTAQSAAPTGTGDVVRILGYQLTNGVGNINAVYFNPDSTWVELT